MPKNCKIMCIVKGCATVGMLYNDHFHKTKKRWLLRIGRMDLDNLSETDIYLKRYRVCSKHFTDRAYTSTLRTGLISQAEPELFLPDPNGPNSNGILKLVTLPWDYQEKSNAVEQATTETATPTATAAVPVVKEENMAIMSVATVYSGSEDEGRAGHNSDSNDLENVPLNKRIKVSNTENEPVEVDPLADANEHIPNPGKPSKNIIVEVPSNEMPSYMKVSNSVEHTSEDELKNEIIKKDRLIRTLEKCLIERSVTIQKLTRENEELKKQLSSLTS